MIKYLVNYNIKEKDYENNVRPLPEPEDGLKIRIPKPIIKDIHALVRDQDRVQKIISSMKQNIDNNQIVSESLQIPRPLLSNSEVKNNKTFIFNENKNQKEKGKQYVTNIKNNEPYVPFKNLTKIATPNMIFGTTPNTTPQPQPSQQTNPPIPQRVPTISSKKNNNTLKRKIPPPITPRSPSTRLTKTVRQLPPVEQPPMGNITIGSNESGRIKKAVTNLGLKIKGNEKVRHSPSLMKVVEAEQRQKKKLI
jgi:hypothetical protein